MMSMFAPTIWAARRRAAKTAFIASLRQQKAARGVLPLLLMMCAGFASPEGRQSARLLTPDRLGPVRLGASTAEAARALGVPLRPRSDDQSPQCWITGRADGRDPGIAYLVVGERIRRIDVFSVPEPESRAWKVASAAGVGLGTAEAAALRAYGGRLRVLPHPYTGADGGHYLILDAAGGKAGVIFETFAGRVTHMRAGLRPELDYVEGCS